SNNTPHPDARGAAVQIQTSEGARADGRGRYTAMDIAPGTRRHPLRALLWCSWACVVWFLVGWAILKVPFPVPSALAFLAVLSGGVVGLGGILAVAFLIFAARDRRALATGIASLLANTGLLTLFVSALP